MNIKLLKEVADEILARPKQIAMSSWFDLKKGAGECGTTGCIAGWAITLNLREKTKLMPLKAAKLVWARFDEKGADTPDLFHSRSMAWGQKALKLSTDEADRLFFRDNWPDHFMIRSGDLREGSKAYARVVHDRILFFIATNGTDRLE